MAEKVMTATWSDHLHQNPGSLLGHQDQPIFSKQPKWWENGSGLYTSGKVSSCVKQVMPNRLGARCCGASKQEHWLWSGQKRPAPHGEGGLSSYWTVGKKMGSQRCRKTKELRATC